MREDGLLRDFGGEGPLLHLAVANGFPPACYRPFMRALREVGHGVSLLPRPLWPERPGPETRGDLVYPGGRPDRRL
jgi:hypothetical protein